MAYDFRSAPATSLPPAPRSGSLPIDRGRSSRRLLAVALAVPTMGSAMGIDGGAIFQILAVEDLGLGPTAIGVGLALSVVSVPFQIWAARIPLHRAATDLQLYFGTIVLHCCLLAAFVALAPTGGGWAHAALGLAITAEISLSVLYATAWQPLLTYAVTVPDRQRINSSGRAAGNVVVVAATVLFGFAGSWERAGLLLAIGGVAAVLAAIVRGLPGPPDTAVRDVPLTGAGSLRPIAPVLVATAVLAFGAWPLFVTYTDRVLWPDVNLGVVAGAQVGGSVVAALVWRPATAGLLVRARRAGLLIAACAGGLMIVRTPVDGLGTGLVVLALVAVAAASIVTVGLALLELTHQGVTAESAVRHLTVFDVVASTSAQLGFLAAGLLISASASIDRRVDPYRLGLLIAAGILLAALGRIARTQERARTDDV